jgi:ClpP class serine protease
VQQEVDRLNDLFVDTVALHRGIQPDTVRATEAGVFFGEEAVFSNLADQIGTLDEAHAALASRVSPTATRGRTSAMPPSDNPNPNTPPADPPQPQPNPPAPQPDPQPQPNPPAPQPDPQPGREASAEVIRLGARQDANARSIEIVELCALAGFPGESATMLRSDMTVEQVRRRLMTMQAERSQQTPGGTPIDPTQSNRPQQAPFSASDAWANFYPHQRRS